MGMSGHEHDATHSTSTHTGTKALDHPDDAVRSLIAQLCECFYRQGWATGTGGGVSIRIPDDTHGWRVFVAPSGIQKEDMIGEDVFCLDMDRNVLVPPKTPGLRQSACTPLWYVVYRNRPTATCVIHTHSRHAVLATLLDPTEEATTLKLTHLEMLKGVGHHAYDDVLEIPIIDNRPSEDQLADQLEVAIRSYPKANCVLVRRHGLYVWGDSWEQAKTQCESFDYLFECAVQMHQMGLDPAARPKAGTYRSSSTNNNNNNMKKRKLTVSSLPSSNGFHGASAIPNRADCLRNPVPLLPRDLSYKVLLLDIEGCTTSISFVHDVLFPYARQHVSAHVTSPKLDAATRQELWEGLRTDVIAAGGSDVATADSTIEDLVVYLMDRDVKSKVLKDLQGAVWSDGYHTGALKGHVYPDFLPLLQWLQNTLAVDPDSDNGNGGSRNQVQVYIYSSGSVQAQKLLFGHSVEGDLLPYLAGHFDIATAGPKKESASYTTIATALNVDPSEIVFVSDAVAELEAAIAAGIGATVLSIRPGNTPLSTQEIGNQYPAVHSLLQLCGA